MVATKVELFELIRRDSWHGGLSVRALAGKYGVHRRLVREALMHADVLMALAQFAGQTVAAAAITDVWEAVRGRFARLLGRGDARKTQVAEQWLAQTRQQLTAAAGLGWSRPGRLRRSGGRAGSRTCWTRTPAWRRSFARWWRRSRPSCLPRRCRRLIIRWRPGGM